MEEKVQQEVKSSCSCWHGEGKDEEGEASVACSQSGNDQRCVTSSRVDGVRKRGEAEDRGCLSASVKCEAFEVEEAKVFLSVEMSSSALVRGDSSNGSQCGSGIAKVECGGESCAAMHNTDDAVKSMVGLHVMVTPSARNDDASPLTVTQFSTPNCESGKGSKKEPLTQKELKRFSCSFCNKVFDCSSHRVEHERIHSGERPYECNFCTKSFTNPYRKAEHERVHTGEKPYQCSFCDKAFTTASAKGKHESVHTGEKPYVCSYCPRAFREKSGMKSHERTHTGEKPYQCSFCFKVFKDSGNKTRHEARHTGEWHYMCPYCGKTFTQAARKREHLRMHTGEKPYKCSFCEKAFAYRSARTGHERLHTGEKPYVCSYCSRAFTHSYTRRKHERTHIRKKS